MGLHGGQSLRAPSFWDSVTSLPVSSPHHKEARTSTSPHHHPRSSPFGKAGTFPACLRIESLNPPGNSATTHVPEEDQSRKDASASTLLDGPRYRRRNA